MFEMLRIISGVLTTQQQEINASCSVAIFKITNQNTARTLSIDDYTVMGSSGCMNESLTTRHLMFNRPDVISATLGTGQTVNVGSNDT
jgi:hypothetical protein